jgi:hypothetical protein
LAGEAEVLRENMSQRRFVHHKPHMLCPDANPGRRGGKPANNPLGYGTAEQKAYCRSQNFSIKEYKEIRLCRQDIRPVNNLRTDQSSVCGPVYFVVRFKFLTIGSFKVTVFSDVTACSPTDEYQYFVATCYLHLQCLQ